VADGQNGAALGPAFGVDQSFPLLRLLGAALTVAT
jgi:hypothetical protein